MAATGLVGRPVGPFSERPRSASVLSASGDGTDFAIGGLAFRLAISDERPYQRATADFRKDQVDNGSDVGDQSLTGWWKRGQLSQHKGAGVDYYEVTDGKAVSDRFKESLDVAVDVPGQVTLAPEWTDDLSFLDVIYACATSDAQSAYLTSTGEVYSSAVLGSYSPNSGTCVGVSSGPGTRVFVSTTARAIEATTTSLGAGTTYYTHSTDIAHIWYAKGRLWVIDTSSRLYQLSPSPTGPPVAIAPADLVCTFTETTTSWTAGDWHLVESPGAVYIGHSSGHVYAVTIASDGSLPTLTAPVEVATLPQGDTLYGLGYYLGSLILQSADGVRTAAIQSDGSVVIGPQFLEVTTSAPGQIAGAGNKAWLAADDTIISLDLSQLIDDANLTYAWVTEHGFVGARGVVVDGTTVVAYGDDGRSTRGTDLAETGYLTTGQHRFGTLEPKQFHAVRVLVGGPGGSITVSRVTVDGAVTTLHTLDVTTASEADISMSLTEPAAAVGLRFDLALDDDGNAPILYGYQLRALPAPRRQRLIRVPLMLFDTERRGATRPRGAAKSAATRLFALESMEESQGTFVFQDFRTGEAGTCYVEKVEHEGSTSPSDQSSGFGGFVYVTLRKLN